MVKLKESWDGILEDPSFQANELCDLSVGPVSISSKFMETFFCEQDPVCQALENTAKWFGPSKLERWTFADKPVASLLATEPYCDTHMLR